MSDTTNETEKLREALKGLVLAATDHRMLANARRVLAETEPKHAAEALFEEWWSAEPLAMAGYTPAFRKTAMHFYRAGMLKAAKLVTPDVEGCLCGWCAHGREIRFAAEKVPKE